jgi:hypothetical protein
VDVAFGAALASLPLDGGKNGGQVLLVVNRSELDYGKARDSLEIAEVQRRDFVAEMQRCRADQQILERKLDTNRFLLAFDTPGQPRNGECDRVHRHVAR